MSMWEKKCARWVSGGKTPEDGRTLRKGRRRCEGRCGWVFTAPAVSVKACLYSMRKKMLHVTFDSGPITPRRRWKWCLYTPLLLIRQSAAFNQWLWGLSSADAPKPQKQQKSEKRREVGEWRGDKWESFDNKGVHKKGKKWWWWIDNRGETNFTCGPFRISLTMCPSLPSLTHPSPSLFLSLSLSPSLSREAGSPDPMWKSATHIPPQSTLLWESQALLHERRSERGRGREGLRERRRKGLMKDTNAPAGWWSSREVRRVKTEVKKDDTRTSILRPCLSSSLSSCSIPPSHNPWYSSAYFAFSPLWGVQVSDWWVMHCYSNCYVCVLKSTWVQVLQSQTGF